MLDIDIIIFTAFHLSGRYIGPMLHLYQNSAATGRKTGQSPECGHHLPGANSFFNNGLYRVQVVEE